jgi:hypothetical protein
MTKRTDGWVTAWLTAPEAAKRLGVRPLALAKVPGFKAVRTMRAPRKPGQQGVSRMLYNKADVEKLRAERGTVTPKRRIPVPMGQMKRRVRAAKKVKAKKLTPNQKKVKAANEALVGKPTNTPALVREFIDMLKERDPSITTVRVEISRVDTEIVA